MKFYIPEIGDEIVLTNRWKFNLYPEPRNLTMGKLHGFINTTYYCHPKFKDIWVKEPFEYDHKNLIRNIIPNKEYEETLLISLPKGTVLKIDRIYIRKGLSDFSSITFTTKINNKRIRFWAKLKDVNNIEFKKLDLV